MSGMERAIGGEQVLLRVMEKLHEQIYSQDETIKFLMDKCLEQRKWVELTDEEINDIVWNLPFEPGQDEIRAIENKLREKNS